MSVKSLIDTLIPKASGYSRVDIRNLIQQAQDELLAFAEPSMLYRDPLNQGYPPFLTTVAGTYRYEIKDANLSSPIVRTLNGSSRSLRCRQVQRIFIDSSKLDYNRKWQGQSYARGYYNPYTSSTDRLEVAEVPVESFPATESDNAYIIFLDDPGATTDKYYVDFLWEAPRLTSESIPLVTPVEFERAISRFVIGEIQTSVNGAQHNFLSEFETYWKPRFRTLMAGGAQINNNETPLRIC